MASRLKQIPESLLAKLWRERASREESLRAGNGRRFKVIYCGRPGTGPGPDFLEAVLEEEGVGLVRGDVELHVRQRDWEGHGHSTDPHYNGVILHVVAGMNGAYTTLQNGRQVPVLSLGPLLEDALPSPHPPRDLWPLLEAHGYSPPASPAEMGLLLDRAGDSWFLGERDGFLALMKEEDPEQVLYASLMEALGYSQNRGPFQELSHRVPYGLIRRAAMGASGGQRLRLIERLLLTTAGFLPASRRDKAMVLSSWRRFRVRPQNHPQRRIMGFARVLERFLNSPESDLTLPAARFRRGTLTAGSWPARVAKAIQSRPDGPRPSGASAVEEPCESWEGRGLLEGVDAAGAGHVGPGRGCCLLPGIGERLHGHIQDLHRREGTRRRTRGRNVDRRGKGQRYGGQLRPALCPCGGPADGGQPAGPPIHESLSPASPAPRERDNQGDGSDPRCPPRVGRGLWGSRQGRWLRGALAKGGMQCQEAAGAAASAPPDGFTRDLHSRVSQAELAARELRAPETGALILWGAESPFDSIPTLGKGTV